MLKQRGARKAVKELITHTHSMAAGAQLVAGPEYPVIHRAECQSTEELLKLKASCGMRAKEQKNWP